MDYIIAINLYIIKNIEKIYGKEDNKVYALNGIDLEIEPKKFTTIIGPSGSGKSTLLHCMAGLDKPTSGNVYGNIIIHISVDGKKEDKQYINTLIKKLGISSQINKFPNELSGGQQQRVAIARALANKPSIIFADEPTGNLDSKTTREVMDILKVCVKEFNQTLVMITHNDEIAKTADRIITISDGSII